MIVPTGKRRQQIAQGERPYQSVFDSIDFDKVVIAQVESKESKPFKSPGGQMENDIAAAMGQGNDPGMSGRTNEPGGRMPGDRAPKPEQGGRGFGQDPGLGGMGDSLPGGMGEEPGVGNKWLTPDGTQDEENQQDIGVLSEIQKLEQAAGAGFQNRIGMKRSKDGAFEALINMPEGYTIQQGIQFANTLMKAVDGELDSFDPGQGSGIMKLTYKSKSLGQPKVEKANKGTRR